MKYEDFKFCKDKKSIIIIISSAQEKICTKKISALKNLSTV